MRFGMLSSPNVNYILGISVGIRGPGDLEADQKNPSSIPLFCSSKNRMSEFRLIFMKLKKVIQALKSLLRSKQKLTESQQTRIGILQTLKQELNILVTR
jgi:hypothetical protein